MKGFRSKLLIAFAWLLWKLHMLTENDFENYRINLAIFEIAKK